MQRQHFRHQRQPGADLARASLVVIKVLVVTREFPHGTRRPAVNPGTQRVLTERLSVPQLCIRSRGNSAALVVEQNFSTVEILSLTFWFFPLPLPCLFQKASEGTGKANDILHSSSRQQFSVVLSEPKKDRQVYEYDHRLLIFSL